MLENLDLIGLLIAIPLGIFVGRIFYKNYCKRKGIDFKSAMIKNSYTVHKISLMLTIFLYFLIRAFLA